MDSVIFADGLCADPDEMGLLAGLDPVVTFGEVFDLLRTLRVTPGQHRSLKPPIPHISFLLREASNGSSDSRTRGAQGQPDAAP
jgi:hypothetical protein